MVEPISAPPSTLDHSTRGDTSPRPPKQTPKEPTNIISPKQELLYLPSQLPLVPTSDHCVFPSDIPSYGSPNMLLHPDPYVLPNRSPSGIYLLPYFITDTVFTPPSYHQCQLQKNYPKTQVLTPSHP